jgi:hypothetical protein
VVDEVRVLKRGEGELLFLNAPSGCVRGSEHA